MLDTLILNRGQVAEVLDPKALLEALREAFRKYSVERDVSARRLSVLLGTKAPDDASAMIIVPGLISGIPAYTVKVHAKFPGQKPAIQGLIVLHDIKTGRPLAVMDSTHITTWRTGLAGALGADVLAREDAAQVAIIGAGVQGEVQLRGLSMVRPIRCARVYDLEPGRSESFCEAHSCSVDAVLEPVGSVEEATEGTDIIVTATWATSPFLHDTMVKPGAHINILGADKPGKAEVSATLEMPEEEQIVEIMVLDAKLPNNKSGVTYLYDTEIYVQVKQRYADKVAEELQQFRNEIKSEITAIWRTGEMRHFQEARLESLTRRIQTLLSDRFGVDRQRDEPIISKCVIVMGMGFRIDS